MKYGIGYFQNFVILQSTKFTCKESMGLMSPTSTSSKTEDLPDFREATAKWNICMQQSDKGVKSLRGR